MLPNKVAKLEELKTQKFKITIWIRITVKTMLKILASLTTVINVFNAIDVKISKSDVQAFHHYVKSVHIRIYSGPPFPAFGLNMERHGVYLLIQSECRKMRTRITPNTYTFYAVHRFRNEYKKLFSIQKSEILHIKKVD